MDRKKRGERSGEKEKGEKGRERERERNEKSTRGRDRWGSEWMRKEEEKIKDKNR